jgi:hypothetical protein
LFALLYLPVAFIAGLALSFVPNRALRFTLLGVLAVLPFAELALGLLASGCAFSSSPGDGCGLALVIAPFLLVFYLPAWMALALLGLGAAWLVRRIRGDH